MPSPNDNVIISVTILVGLVLSRLVRYMNNRQSCPPWRWPMAEPNLERVLLDWNVFSSLEGRCHASKSADPVDPRIATLKEKCGFAVGEYVTKDNVYRLVWSKDYVSAVEEKRQVKGSKLGISSLKDLSRKDCGQQSSDYKDLSRKVSGQQSSDYKDLSRKVSGQQNSDYKDLAPKIRPLQSSDDMDLSLNKTDKFQISNSAHLNGKVSRHISDYVDLSLNKTDRNEKQNGEMRKRKSMNLENNENFPPAKINKRRVTDPDLSVTDMEKYGVLKTPPKETNEKTLSFKADYNFKLQKSENVIRGTYSSHF